MRISCIFSYAFVPEEKKKKQIEKLQLQKYG